MLEDRAYAQDSLQTNISPQSTSALSVTICASKDLVKIVPRCCSKCGDGNPKLSSVAKSGVFFVHLVLTKTFPIRGGRWISVE